jgi:hypothetical protein
MTKLEYCKSRKIPLKKIHDEKWLQDRIENDPSILGLGYLEIRERERKQSTGGRIDFLAYDPKIETMYEIEVMLGAIDESHIIRTIEYWDIEKRRNPSRDHKAVIVAEDITNRFFNVISLMNRSIPIIAIQLNALEAGNKLVLDFAKILDFYESPEDEDDLGGEETNRSYWEKKSNSKSIEIMDKVKDMSDEIYPNSRFTYNKYHVAWGTSRRNIMWYRPRKKEGYCHFEIKVGFDNIDKTQDILENIGISFTPRKKDKFSIYLQTNDVEEHSTEITEIIKKAIEFYS